MNEPVVRYSPVGAVLDTWWCSTQYAEMTTFDSHADDWQTAMALRMRQRARSALPPALAGRTRPVRASTAGPGCRPGS